MGCLWTVTLYSCHLEYGLLVVDGAVRIWTLLGWGCSWTEFIHHILQGLCGIDGLFVDCAHAIYSIYLRKIFCGLPTDHY